MSRVNTSLNRYLRNFAKHFPTYHRISVLHHRQYFGIMGAARSFSRFQHFFFDSNGRITEGNVKGVTVTKAT